MQIEQRLADGLAEVLNKKGYETDTVHNDHDLACQYRYMAGKCIQLGMEAERDLKN